MDIPAWLKVDCRRLAGASCLESPSRGLGPLPPRSLGTDCLQTNPAPPRTSRAYGDTFGIADWRAMSKRGIPNRCRECARCGVEMDALPGLQLCQRHSDMQEGRVHQDAPTSRMRSKSRPPSSHSQRTSMDIAELSQAQVDIDMTQPAGITNLGCSQDERSICQEQGQSTSTNLNQEDNNQCPNRSSTQTTNPAGHEHILQNMTQRPDTRRSGTSDHISDETTRRSG